MFEAKDCPDGHEVYVTQLKPGSCVCRDCFYCLRGSFKESTQPEVKSAMNEHESIDAEYLSVSEAMGHDTLTSKLAW